MRQFFKALKLTLKQRGGRTVFMGASVLFFLLVVLIEKSTTIFSIMGLNFSLPEKCALIFTYVIDLQNSFTFGSLILITLGSILGGINLAFAYTYFKTRAAVLMRSNLYSGAGMFFAFLGVGCAACGTALLSSLLGLFGLSFILGLLPFQGLEIGYLGLGILLLATISLAKKVVAPNVC